MSIFSRNQVLLIFRDEQGADVNLKTTLINDVLAKWLGTSTNDIELSKWIDWSDPASMGYISMPDLSNRGEFVSVPILNIKSLQPV
jgi:phospholipase C